ncbi:MAG: 3,4-dihydroxyphenylacetate 2,3-dioxygenase [Anaerolineae bacterium]
MLPFNITRAAHAEIRVTDFDRARQFYVEALGLLEIDEEDDALYLGALEERDRYSLILRKADSGGEKNISFRVDAEDDLDALARLFSDADLPTQWIEPNTVEKGQGRALRAHSPAGLPVEFFHEMEQRERQLQNFPLYRGAQLMRIDHFNCQVPDVQAEYDFWTQQLGFMVSEYTVSDDPSEQLWAAWLHRKQNVHDVALMNGTGPRMHHFAYWAQDTASILRACDMLAAMRMVDSIERGPGRHGLSNAFFLYLRDPDGNRIELYTSDYIIPDPDFEPIKWKLSDPLRATFWGHHPPDSWFDEASLVEDITTGAFQPTQAGLLSGKPEFAT